MKILSVNLLKRCRKSGDNLLLEPRDRSWYTAMPPR